MYGPAWLTYRSFVCISLTPIVFIMVIELGGVQFGLKSYSRDFKIERAAGVRFEIANMISDQNCTTRSSITTLLHPF